MDSLSLSITLVDLHFENPSEYRLNPEITCLLNYSLDSELNDV